MSLVSLFSICQSSQVHFAIWLNALFVFSICLPLFRGTDDPGAFFRSAFLTCLFLLGSVLLFVSVSLPFFSFFALLNKFKAEHGVGENVQMNYSRYVIGLRTLNKCFCSMYINDCVRVFFLFFFSPHIWMGNETPIKHSSCRVSKAFICIQESRKRHSTIGGFPNMKDF